MCSYLYFIHEEAKPLQYGFGPQLVMLLSLLWKEIQHHFYYQQTLLIYNRRVYRRKYTTNAILVLFYIVLHQQSHKVHAIINAQDEISSSNSISHTLKIYGGFTTIQSHNIFFKDSITPLLQMGKAHCKQMSISHSWFFTFSTTTK